MVVVKLLKSAVVRIILLSVRAFATEDENVEPKKRKIEAPPVVEAALSRPAKRVRRNPGPGNLHVPDDEKATKAFTDKPAEYTRRCGEFLCPDFDLHQPGSPVSSSGKNSSEVPDVCEILSTPGKIVYGHPLPPRQSMFGSLIDSPIPSSVATVPGDDPNAIPQLIPGSSPKSNSKPNPQPNPEPSKLALELSFEPALELSSKTALKLSSEPALELSSKPASEPAPELAVEPVPKPTPGPTSQSVPDSLLASEREVANGGNNPAIEDELFGMEKLRDVVAQTISADAQAEAMEVSEMDYQNAYVWMRREAQTFDSEDESVPMAVLV